MTVPRFADETDVHSCRPSDVLTLFAEGITAFICHSVGLAETVKSKLEAAGVSVPQQASVVAIGCSSEQPPVSGFFIGRSEKVAAITRLLKDQQITRPTTIWLAGQYLDQGTLATPHGTDHFQSGELEVSLTHSRL